MESERSTKKQQFEMKRQLASMENRIRMLQILKQKEQVKLQLEENRVEQFQSIRNNYYDFMKEQSKQKEFRQKLIIDFRDKTQQLKQEQIAQRKQAQLSVSQRKRMHSEMIKRQSMENDRYVLEQRMKSVSNNEQKKQFIKHVESQAQEKIRLYNINRQERFKQQHEQIISDSYNDKAMAFQQLRNLWEREKEILEELNQIDKSKLSTLSQDSYQIHLKFQ